MISLIHPSRGRPQKAFNTSMDWIERAGIENIEHIISTDTNDPVNYQYGAYFSGAYAVVEDNQSVVEATNRAAKIAKGDILVYLSDDFNCPDDWGNLLLKEFAKYSGPVLLKVDDCLQPFRNTVVTIPIMNRAFYDLNKYIFHPDFKSMFADVHLYFRAQRLGALKLAQHLKFPHDHHSLGKCENDDTYKRSIVHWNQGEEMMKKHRALRFAE